MKVDTNKIRELVKEAEVLHKEFQKGFLRVYSLSSSWEFEELKDLLSELYGIIERKFDIASQIGRASSLLGGTLSGSQKSFKKTNIK